jgi:hypothetical protein
MGERLYFIDDPLPTWYQIPGYELEPTVRCNRCRIEVQRIFIFGPDYFRKLIGVNCNCMESDQD